MRTRILLILCLAGNVFPNEPPDVQCAVVYLKYVECLWDNPVANYTFYSRFSQDFRECDNYIVKDGLNVGCKQLEDDLWNKRFYTFETRLDQNSIKKHALMNKVKLFPPTNLTAQFTADSNLCFEWKQKHSDCVESDVRYKINDNNWESTEVREGLQDYCIAFASNSSRYEFQVRSRISYSCAQCKEWSDWSQPVVWGTHNITDPSPSRTQPESLNVWSVVLYCVGGATLLLLIVMLLHHERIRIILIPVVPKPSLVPHDLEEWFDSSKGLKEVFRTDYLERTCSVREYCPVSRSDSDISDSSSLSVSSYRTSCSENGPNPDPNDLKPSSSAEMAPLEDQHHSV